MGERITLDCSQLRDIHLQGDLPNTIYIDGEAFIRSFSEQIDKLSDVAENKETFEEKLILALASNPAMIAFNTPDREEEVMRVAKTLVQLKDGQLKKKIFKGALEERVIAAAEAVGKSTILREYCDAVPRFDVRSMNQGEFVHHVFIMGFHRGWQELERRSQDVE